MNLRQASESLIQSVTYSIILLYPVAVFLGLTYFSVRSLAFCLILVLGLRQIHSRTNPIPGLWLGVIPLGIAAFLENATYLKWQPVLINLLLAITFLASLLGKGPPIAERFARALEGPLPDYAIGYCRKVTKVWLGFFILNGSIAAGTVFFCSMEIWTLYNGLIAYILIGLIAGLEYLVRKRVKRKHEGAS